MKYPSSLTNAWKKKLSTRPVPFCYFIWPSNFVWNLLNIASYFYFFFSSPHRNLIKACANFLYDVFGSSTLKINFLHLFVSNAVETSVFNVQISATKTATSCCILLYSFQYFETKNYSLMFEAAENACSF